MLLSADDYDALLETLDVLSDADLVRELVASEQELDRGDGSPLAEVAEEMRSRGRGPR